MSEQQKDPVVVGSAQVKEEPAQRAGDTEQSTLPPQRLGPACSQRPLRLPVQHGQWVAALP